LLCLTKHIGQRKTDEICLNRLASEWNKRNESRSVKGSIGKAGRRRGIRVHASHLSDFGARRNEKRHRRAGTFIGSPRIRVGFDYNVEFVSGGNHKTPAADVVCDKLFEWRVSKTNKRQFLIDIVRICAR